MDPRLCLGVGVLIGLAIGLFLGRRSARPRPNLQPIPIAVSVDVL